MKLENPFYFQKETPKGSTALLWVVIVSDCVLHGPGEHWFTTRRLVFASLTVEDEGAEEAGTKERSPREL